LWTIEKECVKKNDYLTVQCKNKIMFKNVKVIYTGYVSMKINSKWFRHNKQGYQMTIKILFETIDKALSYKTVRIYIYIFTILQIIFLFKDFDVGDHK